MDSWDVTEWKRCIIPLALFAVGQGAKGLGELAALAYRAVG